MKNRAAAAATHTSFQGGRQGLPSQLWRRGPNRKTVEQIGGLPDLIPFLIMPDQWQLIIANMPMTRQRQVKSQRFNFA
jgi:hypothetical protein